MTNEGFSVLKSDEALRLKAYRDTEKVWTIGWGHTAGVYEGMTITKEQAEKLLLADWRVAENDSLSLLFNYTSLGECPRRDAIVMLSFILGYTRFSRFTTTLNYLRLGRWNQACDSLSRTKWFRDLRGDRPGIQRPERIIYAIKYNTWNIGNDAEIKTTPPASPPPLPDVSHPARDL
jgi:GH24 family phage-related lysozyme (muramidase)